MRGWHVYTIIERFFNTVLQVNKMNVQIDQNYWAGEGVWSVTVLKFME